MPFRNALLRLFLSEVEDPGILVDILTTRLVDGLHDEVEVSVLLNFHIVNVEGRCDDAEAGDSGLEGLRSVGVFLRVDDVVVELPDHGLDIPLTELLLHDFTGKNHMLETSRAFSHLLNYAL